MTVVVLWLIFLALTPLQRAARAPLAPRSEEITTGNDAPTDLEAPRPSPSTIAGARSNLEEGGLSPNISPSGLSQENFQPYSWVRVVGPN